jgi:hypothetical protein
MSRWPKAYVVGALAALDLAFVRPSASAQNVYADRRLELPASGTAGLNGSYWMAALADGRPMPRHERLLVIRNDGHVLEVVDGHEGGVKLPPGLAEDLDAGRVEVTLVHNHPAGGGFSGEDLRQVHRKGVRRVIALATDGSVYEASAGRRSALLTPDLYASVLDRVRNRLLSEASWSRESIETTSGHLGHLVSVVLERAQLIDYRVSASVTAAVELNRYRSLFERVTTAEAMRLEREIADADRRASRLPFPENR